MDLDEQICLTESDKKIFIWVLNNRIYDLTIYFHNGTNFEVIITTMLKYNGRGSCKNISLFFKNYGDNKVVDMNIYYKWCAERHWGIIHEYYDDDDTIMVLFHGIKRRSCC